MRLSSFFLISVLLVLPYLFRSGLIQPDVAFPLQISPSYNKDAGTGTVFTFRFFIPRNNDINNFPTQSGKGATKNQYLGIEFYQDTTTTLYFDFPNKYTCQLTRLYDNMDIPLKAVPSGAEGNIAYCQVTSFDPYLVIIPGYHYELVLSIIGETNSFDNILSFNIFTSSTNTANRQIFDKGTFPNVFIIKKASSSNNRITLTPKETTLIRNINLSFDFTIQFTFSEWFSWKDYVICVRFPKKVIDIEGSVSASLSPVTGTSTTLPLGTFSALEMEQDSLRRTVGFIFSDDTHSYKDDTMNIDFTGFRTLTKSMYDTNPESYIEIMVRYRNTYVIYSYIQQPIIITASNVLFTVFHPETKVDDTTGIATDVYDIFRGGAWPLKFTIKSDSDISNKYILIKQTNVDSEKHVTFIASSCDFSTFSSANIGFATTPKCYPLSYKNKKSLSEESGIFFYYSGTMQANTQYSFIVWVFMDVCGPQDTNLLFDDSKYRAEIKFGLTMYDDIDKTKHGKDRINADYLFVSQVESSIWCYNTYMGEKKYNDYMFEYSDYMKSETEYSAVTSTTKEKLLYREYFDWDIFSLRENTINSNNLMGNLFATGGEKYLYSKIEDNKIKDNDNILFRAKITLQSGNNEKLGQFFPMGFGVNPSGKLVALKGRLFVKMSSKFFTIDSTNKDKCFVSWAFGSPSTSSSASLKTNSKAETPQKYNWITNSDELIEGDTSGIYKSHIETIGESSLYSEVNEGWQYNSVNGYTKAEWGFGSDELLVKQISNESPVELYFGFADTCHKWKDVDQDIKSLFTPIEIIVGIKWESQNNSISPRYARVMRFIKLFPEGGVFHDKSDENNYVYSKDNIITNHFGYMSSVSNSDKGVCLLELKQGTIDALKNKSNTFFLWIFEGSLLESEYSTVSSTYPTGNIGQYVKSYGYSSQHTLYDDSFYAAPSPTKLSDISSPIYSLTSTMTSIYQSGTSSYLYYLGSLIVLNNQFISQSMYADSNGPILIPYYCPYYQSRGSKSPYTMGIFPAFVGGFGSVTSMSNFGNKGLDGLLAKRINYKQFNRVILSDIKMVQNNEGNTESPFYNTIRFSHPSSTEKTLSVWNGYKSTDNENINDIIDSFIFFFTSKVTIPSNVVPTAKIPSTLSSLYTVRNYNFYAFGIKFSHALLGTSDNDISVDNGSPDSTSNTNPYLSIVTNFTLNYDAYKCSDDQTVFCPYNIVGYWGLSSKHDMINFFTNYQADENKFLIDFASTNSFQPPSIMISEEPPAMVGDKAITILMKVTIPSTSNAPIGSILSFKFDESTTEHCAIQSSNTDNISQQCSNIGGLISCVLHESMRNYNIYCYELEYQQYFHLKYLRLELPFQNSLLSYLDSTIAKSDEVTQSNEILPSTEQPQLTINAYYLHAYNINALSTLKLEIPLHRKAYPGMDILIEGTSQYIKTVNGLTPRCILTLSPLDDFSDSTKSSDSLWVKGNSLVYNCVLTFSGAGDQIDSIHAWLKDEIYKAGKSLSDTVYIYVLPVLGGLFSTGNTISLSIKVNSNPFINLPQISVVTEPDNNSLVSFLYNNNNINAILSTITPVTSPIKGDISDYSFSFEFGNSVANQIATGASINEITIYMPYEYFGSNTDNVKCYEGTKLINCIYENEGIINIQFSTSLALSTSYNFVITGFTNPIDSVTGVRFGVSYNQVDSVGVRYCLLTGKGQFKSDFVVPTTKGSLRFFHVNNPISNKVPRALSKYVFRFGFDYANGHSSTTASLSSSTKVIIDFPPEYNLFVNSIPNVSMFEYYSNDLVLPSQSRTDNPHNIVIYNNRLIFDIAPQGSTQGKLKFFEVTIDSIYNPTTLPSDSYTNYYKITCITSITSSNAYYTTSINSISYTSDQITEPNVYKNEYHWYRGNQLSLDNNNKYIIDIVSDGVYNKISLQPGRYKKVYIVTSTSQAKPYLSATYTDVIFSHDTIKTDKGTYRVPSLYGEPFPFYIGIGCDAPEGQYTLTPVLSNTANYIAAPMIYINVKLIEKAKVQFKTLDSIPKASSLLLYYYLSEPNVDELVIEWERSLNANPVTTIEKTTVPSFSITDIDRGISKVYAKIEIQQYSSNLGSQQFTPKAINKCYEVDNDNLVDNLLIQQSSGLTVNQVPNSITLSNYVSIQKYEDDPSKIKPNEIQISFSSPTLPLFAYCVLLCDNADYPSLSSLVVDKHREFHSRLTDSYFSRYYPIYFSHSDSSKTVIMQNLIKGYNYKLACGLQSTDSTASVTSVLGTMDTDPSTLKPIKTSEPPTTTCIKYYFNYEISDAIKQAYVNYCQSLFTESSGYISNGCITCSDASGGFLPPGYILNSFFKCDSSLCYTTTETNDIIKPLYNLDSSENSGSISYTICATANRLCETTSSTLSSIFNTFVTNTRYDSNANSNLGVTSISYNPLYTTQTYTEIEVSASKLSFEMVNTTAGEDGSLTWTASYSGQDVNCYWKLLLTQDTEPSNENIVQCTNSDKRCGVIRVTRESRSYEIPEDKKETLTKNKIYSFYITCTNIVPAPIYYSKVLEVGTVNTTKSSKAEYIKYYNIYIVLLLFLII